MAIVNKPDNGGPAFPRPMSVGPGGLWQLANEGMFLRDNFAGLAMQGFVSHPENLTGIRELADNAGITAPEMLARSAYGIADAMIAERNRTEVSDD